MQLIAWFNRVRFAIILSADLAYPSEALRIYFLLLSTRFLTYPTTFSLRALKELQPLESLTEFNRQRSTSNGRFCVDAIIGLETLQGSSDFKLVPYTLLQSASISRLAIVRGGKEGRMEEEEGIWLENNSFWNAVYCLVAANSIPPVRTHFSLRIRSLYSNLFMSIIL